MRRKMPSLQTGGKEACRGGFGQTLGLKARPSFCFLRDTWVQAVCNSQAVWVWHRLQPAPRGATSDQGRASCSEVPGAWHSLQPGAGKATRGPSQSAVRPETREPC